MNEGPQDLILSDVRFLIQEWRIAAACLEREMHRLEAERPSEWAEDLIHEAGLWARRLDAHHRRVEHLEGRDE